MAEERGLLRRGLVVVFGEWRPTSVRQSIDAGGGAALPFWDWFRFPALHVVQRQRLGGGHGRSPRVFSFDFRSSVVRVEGFDRRARQWAALLLIQMIHGCREAQRATSTDGGEFGLRFGRLGRDWLNVISLVGDGGGIGLDLLEDSSQRYVVLRGNARRFGR